MKSYKIAQYDEENFVEGDRVLYLGSDDKIYEAEIDTVTPDYCFLEVSSFQGVVSVKKEDMLSNNPLKEYNIFYKAKDKPVYEDSTFARSVNHAARHFYSYLNQSNNRERFGFNGGMVVNLVPYINLTNGNMTMKEFEDVIATNKNWYKKSQDMVFYNAPVGVTKEERDGSFVWVFLNGVRFKILYQINSKTGTMTQLDGAEIKNFSTFFQAYFLEEKTAISTDKKQKFYTMVGDEVKERSSIFGNAEDAIVDFEGLRFYIDLSENSWKFRDAVIVDFATWWETLSYEWQHTVHEKASEKIRKYIKG